MLNQNSLERENVECHETEYECDSTYDDECEGDDKETLPCSRTPCPGK